MPEQKMGADLGSSRARIASVAASITNAEPSRFVMNAQGMNTYMITVKIAGGASVTGRVFERNGDGQPEVLTEDADGNTEITDTAELIFAGGLMGRQLVLELETGVAAVDVQIEAHAKH